MSTACKMKSLLPTSFNCFGNFYFAHGIAPFSTSKHTFFVRCGCYCNNSVSWMLLSYALSYINHSLDYHICRACITDMSAMFPNYNFRVLSMKFYQSFYSVKHVLITNISRGGTSFYHSAILFFGVSCIECILFCASNIFSIMILI